MISMLVEQKLLQTNFGNQINVTEETRMEASQSDVRPALIVAAQQRLRGRELQVASAFSQPSWLPLR